MIVIKDKRRFTHAELNNDRIGSLGSSGGEGMLEVQVPDIKVDC
jgi:hypothetical protein